MVEAICFILHVQSYCAALQSLKHKEREPSLEVRQRKEEMKLPFDLKSFAYFIYLPVAKTEFRRGFRKSVPEHVEALRLVER